MNRLCWLLLVPVVVTVTGLATGAGWLTSPTPGLPGFPLGNLATWVALGCLAGLVLLRRPTGPLRVSALVAGLLALVWGLVGRWLSGNWRYSFESGNDGTLWWYLTYGVVALLLVNLCWTLVHRPRKPGDR